LIQINEASLPAASLVRGTGPQPRWSCARPLERTEEAAIPLAASFIETTARIVTPRTPRTIRTDPLLRLLITIAVALTSSHAPSAAEEKMVVDMSKMTCAELTKLGFQDFAGITMWMSGYYNASVRSTVIDLNEFAHAAKTVKDFCATSPRATVMSAAERVLGIKMPRDR
jgi:HdeA/HdeB family protein